MVDTVIIKDAPSGEPAGHADKMVALVDGAAPPADRPQWLPEKFKSAEDMAKAYAELEAKLGKPADTPKDGDPQDPPKDPAKTPDAPNIDPDNQAAQDANKALSDKGLDLMAFSAEYNQNGYLTEDSHKKLEEAGYPRSLVNDFIEGQKARATSYEADIKESIGGDKEFSEMVDWAMSNLSPEELATYNQAVASGNKARAKLAVAGVYQQFRSARPSEPSLLNGANGTSAADVYESVQQMTADMRNPLYKTDPAFRKKVEAKIQRSNIL